MLKKLLKYDMQPIYKVWWIIAASVIGISVVGAFSLRIYEESIAREATSFISVTAYFIGNFSIIGVISSIFVTSILAHYRFYKNFYTDEGYLTFTLPASRKMLLFSKTLNTFIWELLHITLLIICAFIFFIIVPPSTDSSLLDPYIFEQIGNFTNYIFSEGGFWLVIYIFEAIIILLCSHILSIVLIELCITIGAITAKKYKLLCAIGIYYLVTNVLSSIPIFIFFTSTMLAAGGFISIIAEMSSIGAHFAIAILLLLVAVAIATITLILYSVMLDKIERKLNLA